MGNHNTAYWIAAQAGVTPLAVGMPGCAKSASIESFARATGRQIYTLIGSLRDPADIGGYPHPTAWKDTTGKEVVYMSLVPPKWAADCHDGRKWIIFFDELTTVPPAVQAAMLRVIAERFVGDTPLPQDTWMLGAANPPDVAANGQELEPPMANRVCHLKWDMDWESWDRGILNGLNFPAPKAPVVPDDWRDNLGKIGALVVAFRKVRQGLFMAFPEKDRSKASGPWPSPRSWTNAVKCLAAAESVNADEGVKHELLEGCIGYGAANEFSEWLRHLDLPDPETLIAEAIRSRKMKREMKYKHPDRPDKLIALLGSVAHCIVGRDETNTPDRWEAGMLVLEMAARHEIDVALSCGRQFVDKIPKGANFSEEFSKTLFPTIFRALC